jgi:hypothetical protein
MNLRNLAAICAVLTHISQAAVTQWNVAKGPVYFQASDNTAPASTTNWMLYADLDTDLAGDAASVVLQGGNLPSPLSFVQYGNFWALESAVYPSKAALDAEVPSAGTYSIILSGGTLGSLTQQVVFAAEVYPDTPYLTGADYSELQALEVLEPFELNWSSGGTNFNSVSLDITPGAPEDDGEPIFKFNDELGAAASINLPYGLLTAGSNYYGYLNFGLGTNISGSGGFGVDGTSSFDQATIFTISAANSAVAFDDFNDNSIDTNKWILTFPPAIAVDTFNEDSGRLNYVSQGTGDTFIAWSWSASVLSYTQDWSVAVDIANTQPTNQYTGDKEVFFGILVAAEGDIDNNISAEFINSSFGREVATYASAGGAEVITNTFALVDTNTVSMKISFDADTKLLHTAYSTGADYILQTNYSALNWGMTASSVFNPTLFAGNTETAVTNGEAYADNFRIYDGRVLSNEVGLVDLEFLHSFGDGSILLEGNWIGVEAGSSHRVISVDVLTSGGDAFNVPLDSVDGGTNFWDVDVEFPFAQPWDPANDGDWTITFGMNNGTFQSTIIPFTKEDGSSPIPNFYNQPLFVAPSPANGLVTSASSFSFGWLPAVSNANFISVDEIIDGNEVGDTSLLFSDGLPGDSLAIAGATIEGPLSTTNFGPIVFGDGFRRMRINEGYGHAAYNADGIPFVVVKQNESDIIFMITPDVDSDGMDDSWEIQFFGGTNVVNGGANDDFDGDGLLNVEEFIAGVNPTNSGSFFVVEDSGPSPAGFVINWDAVPGRKYGVYWAKTLSDGFETVAANLYYPQNSYTDTVHTVEGCGFYYIDVQLQD